jgi:threonine/homoserine/homoserine lactone efflux protein
MPEWSTIGLFVMAASVLVAVPGPNSLYIIARSVEQGWRAGIASSLGVMVGTMLHIIAAALGVSALLLSSATAFSLVKYAGAAYLVYLGVRAIADKGTAFSQGERFPGRRLGRIFYRGVVVNALNPKTALFFTAFLPSSST